MAHRKLGKTALKAKKYADLRAKQAMANQMLYGSKKYLKTDHSARQNALQRKKNFYNKRGLKNPSRLSFKNLTVKDLKAYETLLDSIINNTYLNPDKYKDHLKKIKENVSQNVLDAFGGSAEEYDDFMESDIFKMLIDMGIDPSTLVRYMQEFANSGLSINDFITASREFIQGVDAGNYTIDSYFSYMDEWQDAQRENDETAKTFKEQATEWFNKNKGVDS